MKFAFIFLSLLFPLSAFAAAKLDFSGPNFYEFFGVERTVGEAGLKSAFRRWMMANHPDKGGTVEQSWFANNAYEILKDNDKRAMYDRHAYAHEAEQHRKTQAYAEEQRRKQEEFDRRQGRALVEQQVAKMAREELRNNPRMPHPEMARLAAQVIQYNMRFYPGQNMSTPELFDMFEEFSIGNGMARSLSERLTLALGVIEITRQRDSHTGLDRIKWKLSDEIDRESDQRHRMFLDRIYQYLTGKSYLQPEPPPEPPVSACEASLRYRQADGRTQTIHIKINLSF